MFPSTFISLLDKSTLLACVYDPAISWLRYLSHSEKKRHDWKVLIEIKYLHTIETWHLPELYILLKVKCSHTQFYRLHLICEIWCSHWSCPMICSLRFGNLVLSSTLLFQHASSWGCKIHFESWWSFLYASQVLFKAALRGGLLALWMPHSSIDKEHCLAGVNMVSCHFQHYKSQKLQCCLGA